MESIFLLGDKTRNELKEMLKEPFAHQYKLNITQNIAAIIIQSWWKKLLAVKYYNDVALQISELALWDDDAIYDLELLSVQSEPILHLVQDEFKLRAKSDDKIQYAFSQEEKSSRIASTYPMLSVNAKSDIENEPPLSGFPNVLSKPKRPTVKQNPIRQMAHKRAKCSSPNRQECFLNPTSEQVNNCKLILRAFQKYKDKKLFQQLKTNLLLLQSEKNAILRYADYNEIQLIKTLPNTYLRFRLDGLSFPPNILYKICSCNIVDVNSFAPRNYSKNSAWYLRSDKNGWRSVNYETIAKKLKYSHLKSHREAIKNKKFESKSEKWQTNFDEDFSNYEMNWALEAVIIE